jgi:quinol monooxygenase YgiN
MVTLVNKLTVTGDVDAFLEITVRVTAFMREQPGYIRSQFLRSLRDPKVFVEIAEWAEPGQHQKALQSDGFRDAVQGLRDLATVDPGLYETVREEAAATRG